MGPTGEAGSGDELFPERFVFGEMHGLIEAEHLARYRWASTQVAGRRVLDAGCGVGYGSVLLSAAGAAQVTGVDISEAAVEQSARSAAGSAAASASFVVGDLAALPFAEDSFDVVVCFETIEHVLDQERALDELRRVLAPNGLLAISSPNRDVYEEGNPFHTHEYTPAELRSALAERFANVRLERQQAWLASLVCDDGMLGADDPEQQLELDARKAAGIDTGRETFTLALASDAELPAAGAVAIFTSLEELDTWRERARSAEQHLERSREVGTEAATSYASLSETHEATREELAAVYAAREREQRQHDEREQALRAEHDRAVDSADAELRDAREQLATLERQTAELERQRDQANTALAAIRASLPWRVSAPLRSLMRRR
jgi:SAM-dependent methyltransferase